MTKKSDENKEKSSGNKPTPPQRFIVVRFPHDISVADKSTMIDATGLDVSAPKIDKQFLMSLAQIATNAWRAKSRMVDPDTGEPKEEMKRVFRHIEAIFEALKQIDMDIVDPTGQTYDSGMALKVVSFERTPGLSREEITETIKPTVKWRGGLIQMAEVIVGTPQDGGISERKE